MSQFRDLLSKLSPSALGDAIQKSQVYRSVFRVGVPDSDRKRMLVMLGNVFLHLHPVKVRKFGYPASLHLVHGRHHVLFCSWSKRSQACS